MLVGLVPMEVTWNLRLVLSSTFFFFIINKQTLKLGLSLQVNMEYQYIHLDTSTRLVVEHLTYKMII